MVELRTLAYFVTTCRAGSFARAAGELDIAVSTLSTTLKALGQDLGLTLFKRSNNTLYPTAAARALMRAAEPLLIAEMFARQHVAASADSKLKHLVVEINLSFTIGGISKALRLAIDRMAAERPDVFVEAQWKDERDLPHVKTLAGEWNGLDRSHVMIGLSEASPRKPKHDTVLLSDPWALAFRLPAGTRTPPDPAQLMAGRIVIPMLAPPLIEQADRYFTRHKI